MRWLNSSMLLSDCSTEFMKHVLPRFFNPTNWKNWERKNLIECIGCGGQKWTACDSKVPNKPFSFSCSAILFLVRWYLFAFVAVVGGWSTIHRRPRRLVEWIHHTSPSHWTTGYLTMFLPLTCCFHRSSRPTMNRRREALPAMCSANWSRSPQNRRICNSKRCSLMCSDRRCAVYWAWNGLERDRFHSDRIILGHNSSTSSFPCPMCILYGEKIIEKGTWLNPLIGKANDGKNVKNISRVNKNCVNFYRLHVNSNQTDRQNQQNWKQV